MIKYIENNCKYLPTVLLLLFHSYLLNAQNPISDIKFRSSKDTTVWGNPILVVAENRHGKAVYYAIGKDTIYPVSPLESTELQSIWDITGKPIYIKDKYVQFRLFNQFGKMNSPYPLKVSDEIIKELQVDTGKKVSDLIINALLLDTAFVGTPKESFFKAAQVDDDAEPEIIVLLDYEKWFKEIIILDKLEGRYCLASSTRHQVRWVRNMVPEVDTLHKVISFLDEIYGSGRTGVSRTFYKFINGRMYEVLNINEGHYAHCMGYGNLNNFLESDYIFIAPDEIEVKFIYTLWSSVFSKKDSYDEIGKVALIEKHVTCVFQWNERAKSFILNNQSDKNLSIYSGIGPDDFFIAYLHEIKLLAHNGNKKQRKALHFFREKEWQRNNSEMR